MACQKCGSNYKMTSHHQFPKRHFRHSPLIDLCRKCHDEIEKLIPYEKMSESFYIKVTEMFFGGNYVQPDSHKVSGVRRVVRGIAYTYRAVIHVSKFRKKQREAAREKARIGKIHACRLRNRQCSYSH